MTLNATLSTAAMKNKPVGGVNQSYSKFQNALLLLMGTKHCATVTYRTD